jgi:hypothetical protein
MNVPPNADTRSQFAASSERASGPPLGVLALLYVALFLAGLLVVSGFVTVPSFPAPGSGTEAIVAYFQTNPSPVRLSVFLSFGGVLALVVFVATVIARFRFFGVRSAWVEIALVLGLMTAVDQMASHLCEWALTWPGVAHDTPATLALFYLLYAFGGPGFAVPMGLFVGGVAWVARRAHLLPGWLVVIGFLIALVGVVTWLNLLVPGAPLLPLAIPLTRFPAFAWLILAGFLLPTRQLNR